MGLSAVAAHVIIFIALVSGGTLVAGAAANVLGDSLEAQAEAIHRLRHAANERITVATESYDAVADRVTVHWRNDGSEEARLARLTLLVAGVVTDPDDVARFRVLEDPASSIWMPGETLEVWVEGQGNVDVALVGPHGTTSYRRA